MLSRCLYFAFALHLWTVAATKYLFSFGDSYTTRGFNINGAQPNDAAPWGNPAYGTNTFAAGPCYIDLLSTVYNRSQTYYYDFAAGGATVNNSLASRGQSSDMVYQVTQDFMPKYSMMGNTIAPWNSSTGVFSILFGINDIDTIAGSQGSAVAIPPIMQSYFNLVNQLYSSGARTFIFLNVPAYDHSPAYPNNTAIKNYIAAWNNQLVQYHDQWLGTHTDAVTTIYDYNSLMLKVVNNYATYNFTDNVCQGGYNCIWQDSLHTGYHFQDLLAQDMSCQGAISC